MSTIADGIAVKQPGDLTFALCREYVDEIVREMIPAVAAEGLAEYVDIFCEGQNIGTTTFSMR